ncbi:MAG: undecaprenyldiphospho-muramoylpentapeptide beta-N-acetylglucosaminyltransferase [Pseudomonadota bacterium]
MSAASNATLDASGPLILLAAGGTGGHLYPAEALARCLVEKGYRVALVTDRRGAGFGAVLPTVQTFRINAASPSGNLLKKVRGAVDLLIGMLQSRRIVRKHKPAMAIGFGGYPSVPPLLAAGAAGIPVVLHEQNAILGRANRMMAPRCTALATAFSDVSGVPSMRGVREQTGNPVRSAIEEFRGAPYVLPDPKERLRVLILGGSQGARVFSKIIPPALEMLPQNLRARLSVTQQCRSEDLEEVQQTYETLGVKANLRSFFEDVPQRLAHAHLVICRAGASTMAELATVGRPAVLIPYPYAADNHQLANAKAMAQVGGGWVVPEPEFTPTTFAARLETILTNPESLVPVAEAARSLAIDDAADRLADLVERILRASPKMRDSSSAAPENSAGEQ